MVTLAAGRGRRSSGGSSRIGRDSGSSRRNMESVVFSILVGILNSNIACLIPTAAHMAHTFAAMLPVSLVARLVARTKISRV